MCTNYGLAVTVHATKCNDINVCCLGTIVGSEAAGPSLASDLFIVFYVDLDDAFRSRTHWQYMLLGNTNFGCLVSCRCVRV
jgi:hypothetical protein